MPNLEITVIADNRAALPWQSEHGLALLIKYRNCKILFDTGAGCALMPNLQLAGTAPETLDTLIFSHGHNDHTGGAAQLLAAANPEITLCHAPDLTAAHHSLHPGKPARNIAISPESAAAVAQCKKRIEIKSFAEVFPGVFLTGVIPRNSGEDCGGPFFLDSNGTKPDMIANEQALLLANGVLVQGCCHAGIINSLEYCRQQAPHIRIHTIIGGLHLLHADEKRLQRTADCLRKMQLQRLILLHCTGENAIDFLQKQLSVPITYAAVGDRFYW